MMGRITKQKKILGTTTTSFTSFFAATDLAQKAAAYDPSIGLATVYRYLKKLEERGEIHSFLCGGRKIYSLSKKNHVHFTCERCNQITHLTLKEADFLRSTVQGELCHFQIDLVGICKKCLMVEKKSV